MSASGVSGSAGAAGEPRRSARSLSVSLAAAWLVASVLVAAAFRLPRLDERPMHGDEANQALKFGQLLERGVFLYDPHEHHGPSLAVLTLPVAHLTGARRVSQLSEAALRVVPAVFGVLLVGLAWSLRNPLGVGTACWSATLTALSSAMVFYSRYYIQEILLVCFSFLALIALWRCGEQAGRDEKANAGSVPFGWLRRAWWPVVLGLSLGLMHASKETCAVVWFSMAGAAVLTGYPFPLWRQASRRAIATESKTCAKQWVKSRRQTPGSGARLARAALLAIVMAAAVSMFLFSSFGRHPQGIVDSIAAYGHYLGRMSGRGSVAVHDHPFYQYFLWLFWWRLPGGRLWSEGPVAVLAIAGLAAAVVGKGLAAKALAAARFLAVYAVLLTALYSLIPYKTPWCVLGPLHSLLLLAGLGASWLMRVMPSPLAKALTGVLLVAACGHEAQQAYLASFVAPTDPTNPWVYAHSTGDVRRLGRLLEQVAAAHPDGRAVPIQVICPDHDYWPLPWYLRRFSRVGWLDRMPQGPPAPVIVVHSSLEAELAEYLYQDQPPGQRHLFMPLDSEPYGRPFHLRPHVRLAIYLRFDLWEAFQARRNTHDSR